jgi:hypothetical protein
MVFWKKAFHIENRKARARTLSDKDARHALVKKYVKEGIGIQIRHTRNSRKMDKGSLAALVMSDRYFKFLIDKYENAKIDAMSVSFLLEIAKALDVALVISFVPFSEFLEWETRTRNKHTHALKSFVEEFRDDAVPKKKESS